jgi:DNA-binding GntR family transcriptional regulator
MSENGTRTSSKPYDVLKQQLRTSEYEPGTVLTEGALATAFGFSRTPIREALLRLEQDGLLVRTTRGMRVPYRTVDEVTNLYDVCMVLEPEAVAIVARRRRPHELLILRDALDAAVAAIEADTDPIHHFDAWHFAIWECTRNSALIEILERLSSQLSVMPARAAGLEHWRASHEQHVAITDLIDAHDAQGAAEAMRAHLALGRDAALRSILTSSRAEA